MEAERGSADDCLTGASAREYAGSSSGADSRGHIGCHEGCREGRRGDSRGAADGRRRAAAGRSRERKEDGTWMPLFA